MTRSYMVPLIIIMFFTIIIGCWAIATGFLSTHTQYITVHHHHCIILGVMFDRSITCDWGMK